MKKYIQSIWLFMVPLLLLTATPDLEAGRGGAIAGGVLGGLALGTIIGSAASRNSYASNEDYIDALEYENYQLREENADLRAALRSTRKQKQSRKKGRQPISRKNYAR